MFIQWPGKRISSLIPQDQKALDQLKAWWNGRRHRKEIEHETEANNKHAVNRKIKGRNIVEEMVSPKAP